MSEENDRPPENVDLGAFKHDIRIKINVLTSAGVSDGLIVFRAADGVIEFGGAFEINNESHWKAAEEGCPALAKAARRAIGTGAVQVHVRRETLVARDALVRVLELIAGKRLPEP